MTIGSSFSSLLVGIEDEAVAGREELVVEAIVGVVLSSLYGSTSPAGERTLAAWLPPENGRRRGNSTPIANSLVFPFLVEDDPIQFLRPL